MRIQFYMRSTNGQIEKKEFGALSSRDHHFDRGFSRTAALEIVNNWNRLAANPVYQQQLSYWIE